MRTTAALLLLPLVLAGCNYGAQDGYVFDPPSFLPPQPEPRNDEPPFPPRLPPTVRAELAPPPLSGGTLVLHHNQHAMIVADADRDQVSFVRTSDGFVRWTIALAAGDQPGRIAVDGADRIHVVLRNAGAIAVIDAARATLIERRPVCLEPRGIAYEPDNDRMIIACAEGRLMAIDAATGALAWSKSTADDLRDVVVTGHSIWVSRFRVADAMYFDLSGTMITSAAALNRGFDGMQSAVAWRMIDNGSESVMMLHQVERPSDVNIGAGGYRGSSSFDLCSEPIVQGAISDLQNGVQPLLLLPDAVVPVDLARSTQGTLAVAAPGSAYTQGLSSLMVLPSDRVVTGIDCPTVEKLPVPDRAAVVSVAFADADLLFAQTREPAQLLLYRNVNGSYALERRIALSSVSREDAGQTIFHTNAGARVACASCHPEGRDDGLVWSFPELGPRRTPSLLGTTLGTAPYHWNGEETSIGQLLVDVYTGRMSGSKLDTEQTRAIGLWVTHLPAPPKYVAPEANPDEIARGEALFNGAAQCSSCHAGPMLTNNASFDVGTGEMFQVPSLVGLRTHAPYLHDGCAVSLYDRFGNCDSGSHGQTRELDAFEIHDLVSYLQTL